MPNHATASGIQATTGIGRSMCMLGSTILCARSNMPTNMPHAAPSDPPIKNPISTRPVLASACTYH